MIGQDAYTDKEQLAALEKRRQEDKLFQAELLAKTAKPSHMPAKLPAIALPETEDVKELARAATPAAVKALIEIVQDGEASAGARISAAQALLDRAHGKPHQSVDMTAAVKHMFEPLVIRASDYGNVIDG